MSTIWRAKKESVCERVFLWGYHSQLKQYAPLVSLYKVLCSEWWWVFYVRFSRTTLPAIQVCMSPLCLMGLLVVCIFYFELLQTNSYTRPVLCLWSPIVMWKNIENKEMLALLISLDAWQYASNYALMHMIDDIRLIKRVEWSRNDFEVLVMLSYWPTSSLLL